MEGKRLIGVVLCLGPENRSSMHRRRIGDLLL